MAATVSTPEPETPTDSTIRGLMHYLRPTELLKREKPYISSVPFSVTNAPTTNFKENEVWMDIHNVRSYGNPFTLDRNGFQYIQHTFEHKPSGKINSPNHPYIGEVVDLLKKLLQPKAVVVYDCNVCSLTAWGLLKRNSLSWRYDE
jgi:hypothetical protein